MRGCQVMLALSGRESLLSQGRRPPGESRLLSVPPVRSDEGKKRDESDKLVSYKGNKLHRYTVDKGEWRERSSVSPNPFVKTVCTQ